MNIILAITGSISAYKSNDICRGLVKQGHTVKVILSKGALEFVNPNTFSYLGAETVHLPTDDFGLNIKTKGNVLHIDLVKWCDRFVICPATANTMAKLASGMTDDLLSSLFLALGHKDCIIFPAMNSNMLSHPITQKNMKTLSELPNTFIHATDSGLLACGDIGLGKLPDPERIVELIPIINTQSPNKIVLITTGATISPLDPVRYLTNPSSGKTGYELAKAYIENGDKVILLYGHNATEKIHYLKDLPNIDLVPVRTTQDMLAAVQARFDACDVYISTAAIADIEFDMANDKLKKKDIQDALKIKKAPDVLATVLKTKTKQKIVGFAAETSDDTSVFSEKWNRKPVDLLIGNLVNSGATGKLKGFNTDSNQYYIIKEGQITDQKEMTKQELAQFIIQEVTPL